MIGILSGLMGVVLLIALNAFFVAAEFGLVSVRRTWVEEQVAAGNSAAVLLRRALDDPDRFIAATQLGITVASLALGWIGEPALAHLFLPLFRLLPGNQATTAAHSVASALAFALITFLHVVAGELMPKSVTLQNPERTALFVARPMHIAFALFRPAIWALNSTGNALLRLLGIRPAAGQERVHSIAELRMLIEASRERGVLREEEGEMLQAVFDLRAIRASRVMVPRTEMVCAPAAATVEEVADLAEQTHHTRFPLFEGDLDQIVGIVYIQDLIPLLRRGEGNRPVRPLAREALFLPETVTVADLLTRFRQAGQHIAILLDEYGGTAGLVTLEDLLEEIVGDVADVFDRQASTLQRLPDGSILLDGLMTIDEVNETLGLHLQDPYYETIGGLVMGRLDRVPAVGDEVTLEGGLRLRVEEMDGLRVARVRVMGCHADSDR